MIAAALLMLSLGSSPDLDAGRKLYDAMQFRAAEARLRLAKEQAGSDAELDEVLYLLARTLVAQRRLHEAEDVYAELLARVPAAVVPADASPLLTESFTHAKERLYPHGFVRLLVKRLPGSPPLLTLVDPWSQVKSVAVRDEPLSGEPRVSAVTPGPHGEVALEPPRTDLRSRRAEALDGKGARLAEVELLSTDAPVATKVEPVLTPGPVKPAAAEIVSAPARTVSRWPEYTLVAVAAAAAISGAVLAVSASADYRQAAGEFWGSDDIAVGQRAQHKALAANLCLGGAVVAAVAAAVVWTIRL